MLEDKKIFSLLQVTQSIQKTLSDRYTKSFWVKCEMNKLNMHSQTGHCYPSLLEKADGKIIAQIDAVLWKGNYDEINTLFLKELGEPLKDGINILFLANVTYSPQYGLKLRITEIDVSYSIGEIEREKTATIKKLKEEKIFNQNKKLELELLPQRIAVISADTSKGYSDFINILTNNAFKYKFFVMLFPAVLQGDKSAQTIIEQLRRIKKVKNHFDCVAIIRGGGADIGLSCYDNYALCKEIAQYPIPVLTGIGHSTNETVAEMVSHKNGITPTDVADFLIQKFTNFATPVYKAREKIIDISRTKIREGKLKLLNNVKYFGSVIMKTLIKSDTQIDNTTDEFVKQVNLLIENKKENVKTLITNLTKYTSLFIDDRLLKIQRAEHNMELLNPTNILKRGYSMTYANGKLIKSAEQVKAKDTLKTVFADGEITSTVKIIDKEK